MRRRDFSPVYTFRLAIPLPHIPPPAHPFPHISPAHEPEGRNGGGRFLNTSLFCEFGKGYYF